MATPVYPKDSTVGGETRAMRGLRLFRERGDEIVFYPTTGEYGVPSRSEEDGFYHVDLEAGTCECPDATCRKVACLHAVAAELKSAEIRRRSGRSNPARRSRRCERRAA